MNNLTYKAKKQVESSTKQIEVVAEALARIIIQQAISKKINSEGKRGESNGNSFKQININKI